MHCRFHNLLDSPDLLLPTQLCLDVSWKFDYRMGRGIVVLAGEPSKRPAWFMVKLIS